MPELPDIAIYVERLAAFTRGHALTGVRIASPFLVRTIAPAPAELVGRRVTEVGRLGKRLILSFDGDVHAVIHLMIAGRLRWRPPGAKLPGRLGQAAFDFAHGTLLFTEASKQKRASLHLVAGRAGLADFDRGGLDLFAATPATFLAALTADNHTIKRALTDPTIIDGVGNAYSDEILHAARMSPFRQTRQLTAADAAGLLTAAQTCLADWTARLRAEVGDGFPEEVTAFRPEMAVHGKYGQPCPRCGAPVQRIKYADNECNYCAPCQTDGRLLADRGLSRLLKADWPKTLAALEERRATVRSGAPPPTRLTPPAPIPPAPTPPARLTPPASTLPAPPAAAPVASPASPPPAPVPATPAPRSGVGKKPRRR
ncbi:MAG: formamidopyrimidine-DNA glycosylase [Kofleriaceae bacterium]|jgi:formamidopyrimidine-DNA glycosylase|nr:formamidopyrimidine-DNA glycosylase [Kofleriaceae bacterium]MBP9166025.1 formamidopyrimidine-DNA glycosylase [Kofleriaceae bacterium]MBP9857296.1 formamidopyrimidine-DNA glycosylase [Kofleriaceae bacterium]